MRGWSHDQIDEVPAGDPRTGGPDTSCCSAHGTRRVAGVRATSACALGLFHWTLYLDEISPVDVTGELGGFLSFYKDRAPAAFGQDFGSWGLDAAAWPTLHDMPGLRVRKLGIGQ